MLCIVTRALANPLAHRPPTGAPEARVISPQIGEVVTSSSVVMRCNTVYWKTDKTPGDTLAIVIDGQQLPPIAQNSSTINGVPNGPHWIKLVLFRDGNQVYETAVVQFQVQLGAAEPAPEYTKESAMRLLYRHIPTDVANGRFTFAPNIKRVWIDVGAHREAGDTHWRLWDDPDLVVLAFEPLAKYKVAPLLDLSWSTRAVGMSLVSWVACRSRRPAVGTFRSLYSDRHALNLPRLVGVPCRGRRTVVELRSLYVVGQGPLGTACPTLRGAVGIVLHTPVGLRRSRCHGLRGSFSVASLPSVGSVASTVARSIATPESIGR